jgi:BMFP domain-containing protein YqiC
LDIVSRGDYENMPAPMYAGEFDDDKMTELAEKIYLCLTKEYDYTDKDLEKYFNDQTAEIDYDLDMVFWREMENIAIEMGMRYYEDMTDEEYEEISKK